MKIAIAAVVLLTATAGIAAPHPRNARAAASCANLFLDDGKVSDAKFFVALAYEEASHPDDLLANARVTMREGERIDTEVERLVAAYPGKAKVAADILLRGAGDLADHGHSISDVHLALLTATKLDPSLRPAADRWAVAYVRAKLTPRTAVELLPIAAMTGNADDLMEIARRALAMHQPKIAALYASYAAQSSATRRHEIALFFLRCSRAFGPREENLKTECLRLAASLDPTVTSYRPPPVFGFAGAGCGNSTSPFAAGPFNSDDRFFPSATYGPPLPPHVVPPDAPRREARCKALSPSLFPEPFEVDWMGRERPELISGPDEQTIDGMTSPCIEQSTWDLVIGADGRVESMNVRLAAYPGTGNRDPAAIDEEQRRLEPVVMKQRYRPAKVHGIPVRSSSWGGSARDCAPR